MDAEQALIKRLNRIDKCLNRVERKIQAFLDGKPYATWVYLDTEASEHVYRVRVARPPKVGLSIAISEFLHNLNSALDNVAWQLASPDPPPGTSFPIFKTRDEYRRPWTRNSGYYATRGMPLEAQAIIEDAQPYHRGNAWEGHPLWVLRRLSNDDKHEALHLAGSAVTKTDFEVVAQVGMTTEGPTFFRGSFEDGAVVARLPTPKAVVPGEGEMHVQLKFAYDVAFSEAGPGKGRPVGPTLTEIRNSALGTIVRLLPLINHPSPPIPFVLPASEVALEERPPTA